MTHRCGRHLSWALRTLAWCGNSPPPTGSTDSIIFPPTAHSSCGPSSPASTRGRVPSPRPLLQPDHLLQVLSGRGMSPSQHAPPSVVEADMLSGSLKGAVSATQAAGEGLCLSPLASATDAGLNISINLAPKDGTRSTLPHGSQDSQPQIASLTQGHIWTLSPGSLTWGPSTQLIAPCLWGAWFLHRSHP